MTELEFRSIMEVTHHTPDTLAVALGKHKRTVRRYMADGTKNKLVVDAMRRILHERAA